MTERNTTIDFMRGLAVILMIFVHATAYFQGIPLVRDLWDYTHIVVPLFVFCSSFIYFQRKETTALSISYILKRAKRLIVPYYVFLIPFFAIHYLTRGSISWDDVLQKLMLSGGRDLSWLVILFIYIIILIPIVHFMYRSKRILFWMYFAATFLTTCALVFSTPAIGFRLIMWLPWSFLLCITLLFAEYEKNIRFYIATMVLAALTFFTTQYLILSQSQTLVLTENKYPPNLYYLSYGIFFIALIYPLHSKIQNTLFIKQWIQPYFDFLSKHSYSIFFIHFLFVKLFVDLNWHVKVGWITFFLLLMGISTVIQLGINAVLERVNVSRH